MNTMALQRRLRERKIRQYEIRRWGLRAMFKRLMILGTIGIVFVLGANYLLVYALNQQVQRERDRQGANYLGAYTSIVRVGQHPDNASELKAKTPLVDATR